MTETSEPYRVDSPIYPPGDERKKVMESTEFYWTVAIANALLINGDSYADRDELIDEAIAIRDKLIEKIGIEKS